MAPVTRAQKYAIPIVEAAIKPTTPLKSQNSNAFPSPITPMQLPPQEGFPSPLTPMKEVLSLNKAISAVSGKYEDTPSSPEFQPGGVSGSESGNIIEKNNISEESEEEGEMLTSREILLFNPSCWGPAWDDIGTLDPNQWLGGGLLAFHFLSQLPHHLEDCLSLYIPMDITLLIERRLHIKQDPITDQDKTFFRNFYGYRPSQRIPKRPVTMVLLLQSHYFLVTFDTVNRKAYVYGRLSLNSQSKALSDEEIECSREVQAGKDRWEEWRGPIYWKAVHDLLGWECPSSKTVTVFSLQWFANGRDCGPVAVFVFESLVIRDGLILDEQDLPRLPERPCAHHIRQQILQTTLPRIYEVYQRWTILSTTEAVPLVWQVVDDFYLNPWVDALSRQPLGSERVQNLHKKLRQAPAQCPRCKMMIRGFIKTQTTQDVIKFRQTVQQSDPDIPSDEESETELPASEDHVLPKHPLIRTKKYSSFRAIARRERHVEAPVLPKQRFQPLHFDDTFDDYNTGPTVEEKLGVPLHIQNFPFNPYGEWEDISEWTLFDDYGYRLDRSFALSFNTEQPMGIMEHFLPISLNTGYEDILKHMEEYSLNREADRRLNQGPVTVLDTCIMGGKEMLEEAGEMGSDASFGVFLQGKDLEGRFIKVDLERDHQIPKDIHISIDVDSLIWITHQIRLRLATKVHMLPFNRNHAPIDIHNHMYVNVLMPQTDKERASKTYTLPQKFKLSSIPHTHFGQIGEGSGSGNIYVFFPRMIHRQPRSGFWNSKIPFIVQSLWFSKVIQPAVLRVVKTGRREYVDFPLSEWRKQGATRTIPLLAAELIELQDHMLKIIQADDDLDNLSIFSSFFFVLDIRGIKLTTKDGEGRYPNAMIALEEEFPWLDLDYMSLRENGECVLDLGVSYSPLDDTPLVGVWKLPHADASFAMGGTNVPRIHAANTLANYGALQAEYPRDRAGAVQFVFRQAYNLYYEVIRKNLKFCDDKDAYRGNHVYKSCVKNLQESYESARTRSYGVREEIRVSLRGAMILIDKCREKLRRTDVGVGPTLYHKSKHTLDRVRYLVSVGHLSPICDSEIPTLIESTSTVELGNIDINPDVHATIDIHDTKKDILTPKGFPLRHAISRMDSEEVKKLLFVYQRSRKEVEEETLEGGGPSEEFPLGDRPTWSEIESAIQTRPLTMIRGVVWQEEVGVDLLAIELFVRFTREYWLTIRESFLIGGYPEPKSLEEALRVWSVEEINSRMTNVTFEAVRAYWSGLPKGRLESTFEERLGIFFPPADHQHNEKSNWQVLWEYGYIHSYHLELQRITAERQVRLHVGLKRLLGHVQCLPAAARCTEGTTGYLWSYNESKDGVRILTNPRYYRICGISKEQRAKRAGPIMASQKEIMLRIRMENEGIPMEEIQRKEVVKKQKDRRSAKVKNSRKPPQYKK